MVKKIFVCILIIICIFSLGVATSSYNNIEKTWNVLRPKRFIHSTLNGLVYRVPYVVYVQKNGLNQCLGTILTSQIVITTASCVNKDNGIYDVLTATSDRNVKTIHNVKKKIIFPRFNPLTFTNDLALLIFHPSIVDNPFHRKIQMHRGNLEKNVVFTLTEWNHLGNFSTLRSFNVMKISEQECQRYYHQVREITARNICTLDRENKNRGGKGDSGGPLVDLGQLVGVYSWTGRLSNRVNPDVFINVLDPMYSQWIQANIRLNHGWF